MTSYTQHLSADKKSVGIIELKGAFENRKSINIEDISLSSNYIQLESKTECLIGAKARLYSNDKYLISIDRERILLFDRNNGKFIREIGHKGNGPDEYSFTYSVMPYNEEKNVVYAGRNKKRLMYSIDGQLSGELPIPELVSEIGDIDDNAFAAYLPNYQGNEKNKIVVFNQNNSVIITFPNYLSAPKSDGFFMWNPNSWFYSRNKQLYFYELFNDTLFHVNISSLSPKYIFNMGIYSPPYIMKTSSKFEKDKYFMMQTLNESSKYLLCSFKFNKRSYTAIYDKDQGKTIVNDYTSETGNGFINNINDFVPLEFSSINEKDELICTIDAFKIKQWFAENSDKIEKLPKNVISLKDIQETDNPVIVIAKLKK
jgi:hypothetical protein